MFTTILSRLSIAVTCLLVLPVSVDASDVVPLNRLTPKEIEAGWVLLFDGQTTKGWHTFKSAGVDPRWRVKDGELVLLPSPTRKVSGADLTTNEKFGDFELSLEWKMSPQGNSGIIYRVSEEGYEHPWESGPEYQLLDNKGGDDPPIHRAGSVWDFYAPVRDVTKPVGEFNHARIVLRHNHVEHWMNGVKLLSYELGSRDFKARHEKSAFRQWPGYGSIARGTIVLQDEGRDMAFRNIKIRRLDSETKSSKPELGFDIQPFRTPYKYGQLILEASGVPGAFDSDSVDTPIPFSVDDKFYMLYIGFDGTGYQSGLATSDNLLHWRKLGVVMPRDPNARYTATNIAVTSVLRRSNDIASRGELKKVNGRYLAVWHAYPGIGYEIGPAVIGLAWSEDLHHWQVGDPILFPQDGASWERGGLYKGHIMEVDGIYYLFYSAKNATDWPWFEQTGVATSKDLKTWARYAGNPIIANGTKGALDEIFSSDPFVLRHRDKWILYYYSLSADWKARDLLAIGSDPYHFEKVPEIMIDVGAPGSVDEIFAHKPYIISWKGNLYHFYNAVSRRDKTMPYSGNNERRGISVARSRPW